MLPLRVSSATRDAIYKIISRHKPDCPAFYFGAVLGEKTVVSLFKKDPKLTIVPAGKIFWNLLSEDISLLINYLSANEERLAKKGPCFEALCLPGMTESFKL